MALLNVRLRPEDERMAAALRSAGVPISALVREAIRVEYERRIAEKRPGVRPSAIVTAILAELPDPTDGDDRGFSVTDRRAVKRHIRAKLVRVRK
jgi:hypothetical protein